MNILIIDIDSKIPNLALKKIEKYHRDRGDSEECYAAENLAKRIDNAALHIYN